MSHFESRYFKSIFDVNDSVRSIMEDCSFKERLSSKIVDDKSILESLNSAEEKKLDLLRNIIKTHSMKTVDGQLIDVQTANAIISVFDKLSDEKKLQFAKMPVLKMSDMAWKLLR